MAIDRMDWHYGAENFPKNLDLECGGTHIGFYLTWIIDNNLEGEYLKEDGTKELEAVRNRSMTGRDFLIEMCDEKLFDEDINEEAKKFTSFYYESDMYFDDLDSIFKPYVYEIENSWENYEKIGLVISKRYQEWKADK